LNRYFKFNKSKIALVIFILIGSLNIKAQDSIATTIDQVESRLLNNSLALMAYKMDINLAQAEVINAKLFNNPTLSFEQNIYNPNNKKFLDAAEIEVFLGQTISIGGKRRNAIALSKLYKDKATLVYSETVRELLYQVKQDFYNIYSLQNQRRILIGKISSLQLLIEAARQEKNLGVLAGNELTRLQAELLSTRNDLLDASQQEQDLQADIKPYLGYFKSQIIKPITTDNEAPKSIPDLSSLIADAVNNRPDVQLTKKDITYQERNLAYQKSLSVPDLTLTGHYDKAGNFVNNYNGLGVALNLPTFNRNQGYIYAAKQNLQKSKIVDSLNFQSVEVEVVSSYTKYMNAIKAISNIDNGYAADLEKLKQNAVANYDRHYISLLEFLDQIRTYQSAMQDLINTKNQLYNAIIQLEFTTTKKL
jgi:cobalt-zinc-cadmium efflux system outer membrane protein